MLPGSSTSLTALFHGYGSHLKLLECVIGGTGEVMLEGCPTHFADKNFIPPLFLLKLSFLRQYGINPSRGGRKFSVGEMGDEPKMKHLKVLQYNIVLTNSNVTRTSDNYDFNKILK